MKNLIVITGQTATGKTSYALKLARENNGELVNADSRQIYKYLNIITGKDLPINQEFISYGSTSVGLSGGGRIDSPGVAGKVKEELKVTIGYYKINGIKLWGYDALDPKMSSSSYYYKVIVNEIINNIISLNKMPIVVGGTYLYIKHLLYGIDTEQIPPNWTLRKNLKNSFEF